MEVWETRWFSVADVNSFRGPSQFEIREGRGCVGFQSDKRTLVSSVFYHSFVLLPFFISVVQCHKVERDASHFHRQRKNS